MIAIAKEGNVAKMRECFTSTGRTRHVTINGTHTLCGLQVSEDTKACMRNREVWSGNPCKFSVCGNCIATSKVNGIVKPAEVEV